MKIIAIEEHFITPEVRSALSRLEGDVRDDSVLLNGIIGVDERLAEIGDERLRLMDASGVDVQVLSLTTPAMAGRAIAISTIRSKATYVCSVPLA